MWKVWINANVQKYAKRQEMIFFCGEPTSVWPQGVTQHRSHLHQVFFNFARILSLFSHIFRTFWCLRNIIKQLFHSRLLDMTLVIANSALRASLAIYHLISNARSWNNCWFLSNNPLDFVSGTIRQHSPRLRRIIVKRKHKNNSNSNNHLINLSLNGFSRAWWLY